MDSSFCLSTLMVILVVMFLGMVILNGGIPTFHGLTSEFFVTYLISFVAIFFLDGSLPEEIGWRGFSLPRWQLKFGLLKSTLLLSVLWDFLHQSHFLTAAQRGEQGSDLSILYIHLPILFCCVCRSQWFSRGSIIAIKVTYLLSC